MNTPKLQTSRNPRNLTILGVVCCLLLVGVAAAMPTDTDRDHWQRLERAASVAQIISLLAVGFVFAQLRVMTDEQHQLNEALAKRPRFEIGFDREGDTPDQNPTEMNVTPIWGGEARYSEPIPIRLIARNVGTSSAEKVHCNVVIPAPMQASEHPTDPQITKGETRYERYIPYVHQGSGIPVDFAIALPRCAPGTQFAVTMSITMAEADRAFQQLILTLDSADQT